MNYNLLVSKFKYKIVDLNWLKDLLLSVHDNNLGKN